jgi:alkylation response protein AidB-like acyl-CoA dehydrogenase
MTTLGFERGASSTTGFRRFARELDQIRKQAKRLGRTSDPIVRQALARAWSKVKIMEINGYRSLTDALNGTHNAAALGAVNKMFWSEYHRETMELAISILGLEGQILTGSGGGGDDGGEDGPLGRRGSPSYPVSTLQASYFFSVSETIWGGTAEIQRNIVGERVLGLPKEPKP